MTPAEDTVKSISLRSEADKTFVRAVFDDDSFVDLTGPRSGLKCKKREVGGNTVYECEFEGFSLASLNTAADALLGFESQ